MVTAPGISTEFQEALKCSTMQKGNTVDPDLSTAPVVILSVLRHTQGTPIWGKNVHFLCELDEQIHKLIFVRQSVIYLDT